MKSLFLGLLLAGSAVATPWLPTLPAQARPAAVPAPGVTKHALIVAVGAYPEASGWRAISSTNDVPLIKTALEQQGFLPANITVLTDAAATKAGIVAALQALAGRVKSSDIVVFHYSGHGQQIMDDNGDEADGYDEALVPYDAPLNYVAGQNEGQHHLRDEELGTLLGAVRQRVGSGGEVLAILDACHSGTGTRGLAPARGTFAVLAPPGYAPPKSLNSNCKEDCSFGANEGSSRGGAAQAPLVCYFGASPSQLNFETIDAGGHGVGSLSLAFSRALTGAPRGATYTGLFDRIKADMAGTVPNQMPQMEGQPNGQVFQGRTVSLPAHYRTTTWADNRTVLIDGGSLHGLYKGTKVALYPPDTNIKPEIKPLATGTINTSELGRATVALDQPVKEADRAAWAVITNRNFGDMAVRLKVDLPAGTLKDSVLAAVKRYPFIQVVKQAPLDMVLEIDARTNKLNLLSSHDQSLYSSTAFAANPGGAAADVVEAATAMSQTRYIRSLNPKAEALDVQLTLIPVLTKKENGYKKVEKSFAPDSRRTPTGNLVYRENDDVQLELKNNGRKAAYFTVLDLQPDNQMSVLIPRADESATDYILQPGQTLRLPNIFTITPPYGAEMFKTIASDASKNPIDLRPVVGNRGARGIGDGNPFSMLVSHTYKDGQDRGTKTDPIQPETVNVYDLTFEIAPVNP